MIQFITSLWNYCFLVNIAATSFFPWRELISSTDFISICVSIATICTAFATFLTVLEMKKGRDILHRPNIVIPNKQTIFVKWDDSDINPLFFKIYKNQEDIFKKSDFSNFHIFKIFNLGLGIAQNIEINWRFNSRKNIEIIQKQTEISKIGCRENIAGTYSFFFKNKQPVDLKINSKAINRLDYLIPIHLENKKELIEIPCEFLFSYIIALYSNIRFLDWIEPKFEDKINIHITYTDVNGKPYEKNYAIFTRAEYISRAEGLIYSLKINFETQSIH